MMIKISIPYKSVRTHIDQMASGSQFNLKIHESALILCLNGLFSNFCLANITHSRSQSYMRKANALCRGPAAP